MSRTESGSRSGSSLVSTRSLRPNNLPPRARGFRARDRSTVGSSSRCPSVHRGYLYAPCRKGGPTISLPRFRAQGIAPRTFARGPGARVGIRSTRLDSSCSRRTSDRGRGRKAAEAQPADDPERDRPWGGWACARRPRRVRVRQSQLDAFLAARESSPQPTEADPWQAVSNAADAVARAARAQDRGALDRAISRRGDAAREVTPAASE